MATSTPASISTRSTRSNSSISSSTPASIRTAARVRSVSNGERSARTFNLEHRQRQRRDYNNSSLINRICLCDDSEFPQDCADCDIVSGFRCSQHLIVTCSRADCNKLFHKACVISSGFEVDSYLCQECYCATDSFMDNRPWDTVDNLTKAKRLGLDVGQDQTLLQRQVNQMQKAINDCELSIGDLLSNNPRPYPSPVHLDEAQLKAHVACGRRFELSSLLYSVQMCTCCGRVKPAHVDPCFPSPSKQPFEQRHLSEAYHKAWHCTCDSFCKGSQFYANSRRTVIRFFKLHHNNMSPKDFLNLNDPNAMLCHNCYTEITGDNLEGTRCSS